MWLVLGSPVFAATLTVGSAGDYPTVDAAVAAAEVGDTIEIDAGTFAAPIVVNVPVTIRGAGRTATVLQSTGDAPALQIAFVSGVRVEDLTLVATDTGQALELQEAEATLTRTVVRGNPTAPATLSAVKLGLSDLSVQDADFDGSNTTNVRGGLVSGSDSTFSCDDCRFVNGTATDSGGAVGLWSSDATLRNSTFTTNTAPSGGAVWVGGGGSANQLTVEDCTFEDNIAPALAPEVAGVGGALVAYAQAATIRRSTFRQNRSDTWGGAVDLNFSAGGLIEDSRFEENRSERGGAIAVIRPQENRVRRNTFLDHQATMVGGAVYLGGDGDVDLQGNWFCRSVAEQGGLLASATWNGELRTTFRNNVVSASEATLDRGSTFLWWGDTDVEIANNTLYGGVAGQTFLFVDSAGSVRFRNNAIVNHFGGGTELLGELVPSYNLYWNNDAAPPPGNLGTNVLADPGFNTAKIDCEAQFRTPAGSPLVDAGDETLTDVDGSRSDIGAYGGPGAVVWDLDDDGSTDDDCAPLDPTRSDACDAAVPSAWFCQHGTPGPALAWLIGIAGLVTRRRRHPTSR